MKKKGEEEETSILEIPFSFNTAFLIEEINGIPGSKGSKNVIATI